MSILLNCQSKSRSIFCPYEIINIIQNTKKIKFSSIPSLFPTGEYVLWWNLHIWHIDTKIIEKENKAEHISRGHAKYIHCMWYDYFFYFHILSRILTKTFQTFLFLFFDEYLSDALQTDLELPNAKQGLSNLYLSCKNLKIIKWLIYKLFIHMLIFVFNEYHEFLVGLRNR